ncbi:MAG: tetratricopeptide repeat protein [Elainellaceae cyanobacterium]
MAKNRLIINHFEGSIQLTWLRGQAAPRSAPQVLLEHPFNEKVIAELRWYLEEYLRFPYGLEPEKAKKTEQKFQDWGQQLFELVFPRTTKAWDFFQEATREGLDQCELSISSDDPAILNLPWELLYNSDYQFLAPSLSGMYRSLNEYAVRAEMPNLPQDKLNILLVIARPYGEKDIALRTIARPLLEALKPIQKQVNLKVLRPPSFEQLERELIEHKGFYHIVHFDGHGDFDPASQGFQHSLGGLGQGVLVFEHPDGSPQVVTAAQIAQSLTDCRVPIFMLNACKSAQEGENSFSSVATRMVSLGAKGVVAMAYSVYAEAAKHFIGRVYEQLVGGNTLSAAVAAGRREILNKRQRPSPKGNLPLQDWLVPVLYQQETYAPFTPSNDALDIDSFLEEPTAPKLIGFPEEGAYGFVGRDYDILRLERSLRQNSVVLLQGLAGVGKTQLACGFTRWLMETQGRSLSFFQSFEHGASLVNVVNQVGRTVWGDKFSQYAWEQQQKAVLNYLRTQPCLLIWDNFEPVAGFPNGNAALLTEIERESLNLFLKELRGGKSCVLITSRREEPWLDCGYKLLNLHGLQEQDVEELAARILEGVGVDRTKLSAEYLELLKLLGGHPFCLKVVLPHLHIKSSKDLIRALRLGLDTFQGIEEEGREKSLIVSLDYSFARLSEKTQWHLPFLSLFCDQVDANRLCGFFLNSFLKETLTQRYEQFYEEYFGEKTPFFNIGSVMLSSMFDDGFEYAYQAVFREKLQADDWTAILNEATATGLLERDKNSYRIHPALPWYLRKKLLSCHTEKSVNQLEEKLLNLYAKFAEDSIKQLHKGNQEVKNILQAEEFNLLHNLRIAEQKQSWKHAQIILKALAYIYFGLGRNLEFRALRQQALQRMILFTAEARSSNQDAFNFWIELQGAGAREALQASDWQEAKIIYQEILNEIISLNDPTAKVLLATINSELGHVERHQGNWNEAITYYQKALKVFEENEEFHRAASVYHDLGIGAQHYGHLDEAVTYYQKALKIFVESEDFYHAAFDYSRLGEVERQRHRFEEAINYHLKALKIFETAGDSHNAAQQHKNLGIVAREQRRFEEAIRYHRKALQIFEDAMNLWDAANIYQELGKVAHLERHYDEAVAYYQKACKIHEDTGNSYSAAHDYHSLGSLAQEQYQFDQAIAYYQKALSIYEEAGNFYLAAQEYYGLGTVARQQQNLDKAAVYYQKALKIFEDVSDFHSAAKLYHELGILAYEQRAFEKAVPLFKKALKIFEDSGDFFSAAKEYHELGMIAQEKRCFDEAVVYYRKAIQLKEDSRDFYGAALDYYLLGVVTREQQRLDEAIAHLVTALKIFMYAKDAFKIQLPIRELGNIFKILGRSQFEATWRKVINDECPEELRLAIQIASEAIHT